MPTQSGKNRDDEFGERERHISKLRTGLFIAVVVLIIVYAIINL